MEKQEDKVIAANISHYTSTSTRLHRDWVAGIGFGFGFVYSSLKNLLLSTLLTTATILGITGGNQDIVTMSLDSFFCLHVPVVIFHIWMPYTVTELWALVMGAAQPRVYLRSSVYSNTATGQICTTIHNYWIHTVVHGCFIFSYFILLNLLIELE